MTVEGEIAADGWLRAARYTLIFVGVCYLLFIPLAPLIAWTKFNDPSMSSSFNLGFGIGFSLVMLVLCVGLGVLNFVAASGIKKGKRWAWIAGVALGGIYAPSICLPFGVVILYGLLRERVRNFYLNPVAPAA